MEKQIERKIKSLSWSKINSFQEYFKQFVASYFEEEPFFESNEILFWQVMSTILELNSFDFEEILNHISKDREWNTKQLELWKIDKLRKSFANISENETFCENLMSFQFNLFSDYERSLKQFIEYKPAVDWVYSICCLWYLDNSKPDLSAFREFKTWKKEWTQERANEHWQLYFYSLLIEAETGKLPEKCYLDWIVTEDDEEWIIKPTWEIKTFEVLIDKKKVEKMKKSLPKIFNDMQKAYEKWLEDNENKLEINEDIFEDYANLIKEKEELEEKIKKAKEKVDEELKNKNLDSHKIEWVWNFYYQVKKSWNYDKKITDFETKIQSKYDNFYSKAKEVFDDKLKKLDEKFKDDFNKLAKQKKEFEKNNEAEILSKTLAFKADKPKKNKK